MAVAKTMGLNDNTAFDEAWPALPAASRDYVSTPNADEMLIVVVAWSIVRGREDEFLSYWSQRETITDRAGLIGEFLNRVRGDDEMPCATWRCSPDCSTFLNVGIWRSCAAFEDQLGAKIRGGKGPQPFEYEPRRRLFLGPERWRLGGSLLPIREHAAVR